MVMKAMLRNAHACRVVRYIGHEKSFGDHLEIRDYFIERKVEKNSIGSFRMKNWVMRATGSAIILGILFWFLPVDEILAGFRRLTPGLFFGVLAVFVLGHGAAATKWWLLLGRGIPIGTAQKAHFAGLAANLCLPGAVGGDAVRAGLAHAVLKDGPRLTAGSVADRMIDMVALAFLALGGALSLNTASSGLVLAIEAGLLLVILLLMAVYALPMIVRIVWGAIPRLPARGLAEKVAASFSVLGRKPGLLVSVLLLSVAIQATFIALSIMLARAVGIDVPNAAWFFAWPLAKIIAVAPVSLGGLGVREGVLAALLVPFGAVAAEVVAAGLIWQAVLYCGGAIGALVLVVSNARAR
jgi:uncharacterized membrane protein YbhN (UPF0104 family)